MYGVEGRLLTDSSTGASDLITGSLCAYVCDNLLFSGQALTSDLWLKGGGVLILFPL